MASGKAGSMASRSTAEESQCGWRAKARVGESSISEMVLERQGPRPGWALSEQLSGSVTDPSPALSVASFSCLLRNPLLTEGPSVPGPVLVGAEDTALPSEGSPSLV